MARITHRDFSKGIWLGGDRDAVPRGYVRRGKNIRSIIMPHIRSRPGGTVQAVLSGSPLSIVRFDDKRYVQIGGDLQFQNGPAATTVFSTPILNPNQSGQRYVFATGIPTIDTRRDLTNYPRGPEHLYVLGGGVSPGGVATLNGWAFSLDTNNRVRSIGLPPPPDNWQVAIDHTQYGLLIDAFAVNALTFEWITDLGVGQVGIEAIIKQEGSTCMRLTVGAETSGVAARRHNLDLHQFIPVGSNDVVTSPDEDTIDVWVHVDKPKNLDAIELFFDVSPGANGLTREATLTAGLTDYYYSFRITVDDSVLSSTIEGTADAPELADERSDPPGKRQQISTRGGIVDLRDREEDKNSTLGEDIPISTRDAINKELATTRLADTENTWTRLRIPKSAFTRHGRADDTATNLVWRQVYRILIRVITNKNGGVVARFDHMILRTGIGTAGEYKVALTYWNDRTGVRSNPTAIQTVPGKAFREPLQFINLVNVYQQGVGLGVAGDMYIEEWRTLGNGNVMFFAQRRKLSDIFLGQVRMPTGQVIPHSMIDLISDYPGVQGEDARFLGANNFVLEKAYLKPEKLPFDNIRPPNTVYDMVVAGGRAFYLDGLRSERNKILYSPPGRLESIEGYIFASSLDNPLVRLVFWNQLYAFSEGGEVYEVTGDGPFRATKILGVPGSNCRYSIVPTPFGIVYRAKDGVRVFDGASSRLVAPEAITPAFRGEAVGSVTAFIVTGEFVTATYKDEEYFLTETQFGNTVAVNLRTGSWRQVTSGSSLLTTSLYCEPDTNVMLAGRSDGAFSTFESPGALTDGNQIPIDFEVETPGTVVEDQSDQTKLVQRLYLDIDTSGQTLDVVLVKFGDGSTVTVGTVTTALREIVEYSLAIPSDVVGVRLSGSLTASVDLYGVMLDYHPIEPGGART